jgi:hypothetical protein
MRKRSRVEFKPILESVERRALMSAAAAAHPLEVISTHIGVGSPFGPFTINATTPRHLDIYVMSERNGRHSFRPFADISRGGVVINGIEYRNVKIRTNPVDENGDGIRDAIITISPRSAIGLTPSTTSLTVSGMTRPGTAVAHEVWTGTASISVGGTAEQPFTAYVKLFYRAPQQGAAALQITLKATPGKPASQWRLPPGDVLEFQTANGIGAHMFEFSIQFSPSKFTINSGGEFPNGTNPSNVPIYDLVYIPGSNNQFRLERHI